MLDQDTRPFRGPFIGDAGERTLYTFHSDRLWEAGILHDLMIRFPRLTIEDISKEPHERSCSICRTEYQSAYIVTNHGKPIDQREQPVKLPCGHVFGYECLSKWLPHNTCPVCRKPLLYGHRNRYGKLRVKIEQAELLRDLEVAAHFIDALHRHTPPDPTRGPGTMNLFRGPEREIALIREDIERRAASRNQTNPNRIWLNGEIRRIGCRREFLLYQYLQAEGIDLPSSGTLHPIVGESLDGRQERALFEYMQQQGAFHYPLMDQYFQHHGVRPLADEEIHEKLRGLGLAWQSYGAWKSGDGLLVWLSAELWAQLERWRHEKEREDKERAGWDVLRDRPREVEDALAADDEDLGVFGFEEAGIRQGSTLPSYFRGLVRRACRRFARSNRLRRRNQVVHWTDISISSDEDPSLLERDHVEKLFRNNGTWEVDLA